MADPATTGRLLIACMLGGIVALGAINGVDRAWPRAMVHSCGAEAEPALPSAEEIAKMKEEFRRSKERWRARQTAYAKRCIEQRGLVLVATGDGTVACQLPQGMLPPVEWLEGKDDSLLVVK